MALHGVIKINGHSIVGYKIVRQSPTFCVDDTICTYRWTVQRLTPIRQTVTAEGTMQHRYGDGMEVLLAKVLAVAGPLLLVQEREQLHKHELEQQRLEKQAREAELAKAKAEAAEVAKK